MQEEAIRERKVKKGGARTGQKTYAFPFEEGAIMTLPRNIQTRLSRNHKQFAGTPIMLMVFLDEVTRTCQFKNCRDKGVKMVRVFVPPIPLLKPGVQLRIEWAELEKGCACAKIVPPRSREEIPPTS